MFSSVKGDTDTFALSKPLQESVHQYSFIISYVDHVDRWIPHTKGQ